jgi:Orsellinic acid/F9775 biosynthesis cluster protein D
MGVGKQRLNRHLQERHTITQQERKTLVKALKIIPMIETEATFPSPAHHSEPIRGLEILDGFKCNDCEYLSISKPAVHRHVRNSHQRPNPLKLDLNTEQRYTKVKVQQWVATGKDSRYWMVKSGVDVQVVMNAHGKEGGNADLSMEGLSWEERMERVERARLSKQDGDRMMMTDCKSADDTTPWLLRNKWPETFAGKSLRLLGRTRYSDLDPQTRTMFPNWTDRRTKLIGFTFDKVMMRARSTLLRTSDSLRCWLQSSRRAEPARRPFRTLQTRGTDQKYSLIWKQFLYYCLRVFSLDSEMREEQYGIEFTAEQLRCLAEVDELLDEVLMEREDEELEEDVEEMEEDDFVYQYEDEEDEEEMDDEDCDNPPPRSNPKNPTSRTPAITPADRLTEKLFEMCIKFLTQNFRGGEDEVKTPLLHFCGVLGIDWKQSRFRDPGNFTPLLAGIMWVGRLLLLEYALPAERYSMLGWPSREYYNDHQWRLESLRREFMLEGCLTPLGNMVGLMAYGKYITKQLGRLGVVTWDADGEGLQIKDTRVTMVGFKSYVQDIISEAQDIVYKDLLFSVGGIRLDLLNMRDVMMEKKNGFSMIDIETNRIDGGLRYMLNMLKLASPEKTLLKGESWRRDRVLRFLERKKRYSSRVRKLSKRKGP